jgi:hypothetical protein
MKLHNFLLKSMLLIAALFLSACSSVIPHQAQQVSNEIALNNIEQVLKEQPKKLAPIELVMKADHFEIKRNRQVPISIYFNSVKDVVITYKKYLIKPNQYRISIIDKGDSRRLTVVTYREDQAKLFVDAMYQLSKLQK